MSTSLTSLILATALLGQAQSEQPDAAARQEQLRYFKEKVAEFALYQGSDAKKPLPLTTEPVLRYSNAEREIGSLDGATFLWLEGTRPIAAISLSIRTVTKGVYRECTSFSSSPLECRSGEAATWSPKTGGLLAQRLAGGPAPAERKPQRLTQMRALARRFTAACYHPRTKEPTELRLLPQPLYRFDDDKAGILDGALFSFVVSNDPELFLLLEAVREPKEAEAHWRYSLARMSSHKETVRLDDKEVWSIPNFYQDPAEDRKTGPYTEGRVGTFLPSTAAPQDK